MFCGENHKTISQVDLDSDIAITLYHGKEEEKNIKRRVSPHLMEIKISTSQSGGIPWKILADRRTTIIPAMQNRTLKPNQSPSTQEVITRGKLKKKKETSKKDTR